MTPHPDPETSPFAADAFRRSALLIVFLVVFIDLLGFGIVLPILPRLAEDYMPGLPPAAQGAVIGVLFSAFSLMQFVFSPAWGRLSDRIGRRPVLLVGLAGSVVFYGLFAFAVSLPAGHANVALGLMLAARVGAGVAGATIGTASAVIADCTAPEKRAKGMALIGVAFGLGFTLGPLIAYFGLGLFSDNPWGVGAIASLLSLAALLLAVAKLPETRRPGGPPAAKEFFSLTRTLDVLRMPTVGPLILIYFLAIVAFANFEVTLALFTKAAFDMSNRDNFLVFAFVGFVLIVAQGGFYRRLAGKLPEGRLLALGVGMMMAGLFGLGAVALAGFLMSKSPDAVAGLRPMFFLTAAIAVFGFAFVNPSVSALVSRRADPHRQGEVLGVNQACNALGRIVGPFVGSVVFQLHDSRVLPYAVGVGLLAFVLALLPAVGRKS